MVAARLGMRPTAASRARSASRASRGAVSAVWMGNVAVAVAFVVVIVTSWPPSAPRRRRGQSRRTGGLPQFPGREVRVLPPPLAGRRCEERSPDPGREQVPAVPGADAGPLAAVAELPRPRLGQQGFGGADPEALR